MGLRGGSITFTLLAAFAVALWGWGQRQQVAVAEANNQRLQSQHDRAQEDRDRHMATANTLKSVLERERDSQAKLLALQVELRQSLAQRERLIEVLKHENEQLRDWADQPLPDAARRLRERPALTGADAYRQWLSGGHPLPVTAYDTDTQRRSAH